MPQRPSQVLLVDDHPMIREGLKQILSVHADLQVCAEAESVDEALVAIERCRPDLVIVDLSLVKSNGLDLVRHLHSEKPDLKTLVYSHRPAWAMADRVMKAGARGYLPKSAGDEELLVAIRSVLDGETRVHKALDGEIEQHALSDRLKSLTDDEYQVFEALADGDSAPEIAERTNCGVNSVRTKLERLRKKLGFASNRELQRAAIGWQLDAII